MAKIKFSKTLKFLTAHLNKITGGDLEFRLETDDDEVQAGEVIRARAIVRAPEGKDRTLTRVSINLRGQVQRDGQWQDYGEDANAAEDVPLPAGHEYVIPIVIKIPREAVLSEDGANWRLRAQAVVDRTIDPRDEVGVTVIA